MLGFSNLFLNSVSLLLLSPGDKLCSTDDCILGTGVYQRHGYIYSSLAGYVLKKNEGEQVKSTTVCVYVGNYGAYQMTESCFCSLKVNWLGEVKCSVEIEDISPHFPQLPVISVVRETETQLLPDVGAIVTCKVRSDWFQSINKVIRFGFVWGVMLGFLA